MHVYQTTAHKFANLKDHGNKGIYSNHFHNTMVDLLVASCFSCFQTERCDSIQLYVRKHKSTHMGASR